MMDMPKMYQAITVAVKEAVAKVGIAGIRQMSMFPSAECNQKPKEGHSGMEGWGGISHIVLDRDDFNKIAKAIANPPKPTEKLVQMFAERR